MKKNLVKSGMALLAAIIWGFAFVAQKVSSGAIKAFTFNTVRSIIAFLFLLFIIAGINIYNKARGIKRETSPKSRKMMILGGIACGAILATASALQQLGIEGTETGKAGFITAAYIILVPILGLFFRKKTSPFIWISVIIAVAGLYLLCMNGSWTVSKYDLLVIGCSIAFACHILAVDYFVSFTDGIRLSCIQFLTVSILSSIFMFIFEKPDMKVIMENIWPILYVGIFSSGVAYTLQILAQKDSNPTVISVLLSLESLFSVVGSALLLHEMLSLKEYMGCLCMFIAVMLSQLPIEEWIKKKKARENSTNENAKTDSEVLKEK